MGKYKLCAKGISEDVEADFLPRVGEKYLHGEQFIMSKGLFMKLSKKKADLRQKFM